MIMRRTLRRHGPRCKALANPGSWLARWAPASTRQTARWAGNSGCHGGNGSAQLAIAFHQARSRTAEVGLADGHDAVVDYRRHLVPSRACTHLVGAVMLDFHPAPAHRHDVRLPCRRVGIFQWHALGVDFAPGIAAAGKLDDVVDPGAPRRRDHRLGPPLDQDAW